MRYYFCLLLFCNLLNFQPSFPSDNSTLGVYDQKIMTFINQQKQDLNIPSDIAYRKIEQKFGASTHSNGWPRSIVIEFENHLTEDRQFAYYHMMCLQRISGMKCSKQTVAKIKYNNIWTTNYIVGKVNAEEIIQIMKYADLNKPEDWSLPVLNIKFEGDLYTVCFGHNTESYSPENYQFERKCLPIKRSQQDNEFIYEAKFDLIEHSLLIID